jgi:Xaa-Pro aminopeptidase
MNEERHIKHNRVVEYLDANGLDGVLLSRRCNFNWYTCGARNYVNTATDVGNSWLMVERQGAHVITSNIEAARLRAEDFADGGIEVLEFPYYDASQRSLMMAQAIAGREVAADAVPDWLDLPRVTSQFDRLRWTLTAWEIDRYRSVCADTAAAVESVARRVVTGQTECQAAAMLAEELLRRGCLPWVLLVAADDGVRKFRHPLATATPIEKYFMLVTCAERGGLICACSRLASFGPLPSKLEAVHQAVCTVDAAMISATMPGATLGDVFVVAQEAYKSVGFPDQWQMHHQGGSCGYLPREVVAGPGNKTPILADQAFAWNPSITGSKSEDTILCTSEGPEVLAGRSDWPMIQTLWKGAKNHRPAILVR